MGVFLPGGADGGRGKLPEPARGFVEDGDLALLKKVFGRPELIPESFWAHLVDYIAVNQPQIPISQILGFAQFTAIAATPIGTSAASSESTASTSFTDLATVGPQLTGLADGKYVIIFGASIRSATNGEDHYMSVDANGAGASDADALFGTNGNRYAAARAITKTLQNGGNNSLTAKYKTGNAASDVHASHRWLLALKYANP